MRRIVALATLLSLSFLFVPSSSLPLPVSYAQQPATDPFVKLPATKKAKPNRYFSIKAQTNCKSIKWIIPDGLEKLDPQIPIADPFLVVLIGDSGTYTVQAYGALGDQATDIASCVVTVGTPVPVTISVNPATLTLAPGAIAKLTATVSGPDQSVSWKATGAVTVDASGQVTAGASAGTGTVTATATADPAKSASCTVTVASNPAGGLAVLIVLDVTKTLPSGQEAALTATAVRDYLRTHCVKGASGQPAWRIWYSTTDPSGDEPLWKDILARAAGKPLPWINISAQNGGFEGALPADTDGLLTLLKKYGGQ